MPNIFLIVNVKNIFRTELQETFVVEDCLKVGFKSTDTFHSIASSSSMNVVDGVATGFNQLTDFSIPMSSDFEIMVDYQNTGLDCGLIFADVTNTDNFDRDAYSIVTQVNNTRLDFTGRIGTNINFNHTEYVDRTTNRYNTYKFIKKDGYISVYFNDVLLGTEPVLNNQITNLCIGMFRWSSNTVQSMKNIKVKAL